MNANEDCVAYAGHLKAEHRELHQRLRALQSALNQVQAIMIDAPLRERMLQTAEQLRQDLWQHFRQEDADGCLEYAVSLVPGLAPEARALTAEHPGLLVTLDAIIAELRSAQPMELSVAHVKQKFDAFVVQLLSHEARENRVIERGFNLPLDE